MKQTMLLAIIGTQHRIIMHMGLWPEITGVTVKDIWKEGQVHMGKIG